MQNEVVLHIGMHKTGSTSIQNALEGYDDGRIRYARLMHANHSYTIRTVFGDSPEKDQFHAKYARSVSDVAQMKQEMVQVLESELNLGREKLMISGEGISGLSESSILRLKEFFFNHVPSVKIIAYVREPIGFTSSWFQQRVWEGGITKPKIPKIGYRTRFEKFIDIFGSQNVSFVKFDPNTFNDRSVVSDFCDRMQIDFGSVPSLKSNPRRSEDAVKLMYMLHRRADVGNWDKDAVFARNRLRHCLSTEVKGKGFQIPQDVVLSGLDFQDVRWMEEAGNFSLMASVEQNTDREKTSRRKALAGFMEELEPSTTKILERCLGNHQIEIQQGETTTDLLLKLFGKFVQDRKSQKPAKTTPTRPRLRQIIRRIRRFRFR